MWSSALSYSTLTFDLLNRKLVHQLLLPWGTFRPILVFLSLFVFKLGAHTR